jgi:deoxyribodipyrimidine photo-lyase
VDSLPRWARESLEAHGKDKREHLYSLEELDAARTGDGLWNASQRELRERGRIHNYLRMLWGKKLLEWSPTPAEALQRMAHLNDRYALDGRDPASVANFMWVLGLHDRPFQERKVLGKVRPMSSLRTAEKFDLGPYLARWARPEDAPVKLPRRRAPRK